MPSSLTTLLPLALGFSPHLPVSVCGTGAFNIHIPFLATRSVHFPTKFQSLSPGATNARDGVHIRVSILNRTLVDYVKVRIEAPVNGGRNYNGPKVAKFLVR